MGVRIFRLPDGLFWVIIIYYSMPKVSVVVPNYNYAKYLPKRMESIFSQTYKDYEVLFLDDASTDNSMDVIGCYLDRIDRVIVNEANSGNPYIQWMLGIEQSSGDFIWIAEADDFCDPTFLEKVISKIGAYDRAKVGMAYCQTVPVDERGEKIGSFNYIQYTDVLDRNKWLNGYYNSGKNEVEGFLAVMCTIINVSSVLFRKSALLRMGGVIDPSLRQAGDWLAYIRILEEYDIAYVSDILNYHRLHTAKVTSSNITNLTVFKDMLLVFKHTRKHFELTRCVKEMQFNAIVRLWDDHYDGPSGRITKRNNLILLSSLLRYFPSKFSRLLFQYFKTFF
jgi:glycosyltransferase involved in cell wall biosynthesis